MNERLQAALMQQLEVGLRLGLGIGRKFHCHIQEDSLMLRQT